MTRAEKFLEMLLEDYGQSLAAFAARVKVSDRQVRNWKEDEYLSEAAIERIADAYAIPVDILRAVANAGAEMPEEYRGKESWMMRVAGIESEATAVKWLKSFVKRKDAAKIISALDDRTVERLQALLINVSVGGVHFKDHQPSRPRTANRPKEPRPFES